MSKFITVHHELYLLCQSPCLYIIFFITINTSFWRIFYSMLQVYPLDSHQTESQLYEDLSQIIKAFKHLITLLDHIASNLLKFDSTSHLFHQLKQTLDTLHALSKIYLQPITHDSQHKNTFHRFICRLIESISAYKLKLQGLPYFTTLSNQVKEIQTAIMSYQQDKNVGLIIKKIQNIVNRFCSKTIKALDFNLKPSDNHQKSLNSQKPSSFTTVTHEYSNPDDQNEKFIFTINEIKPKKVVQSKSENSLNKVMNLLNRKYRTLACLDVEYHEFKQLFFRSRDSRNELYDDCFERNSFIYKEILRYSKQFSEFLEKRDQKIYRKNKFVESLGQNNIKVKNKFISGKNQESTQINFNFTKKKTFNNDVRKMTENIIQNPSETTNEFSSTFLLSRSQLVDDKFSNLVVSSQYKKNGQITPQLIEEKRKSNIFPMMVNGNQFLEEKDDLEEINTQTLFELSKRKKNLQLKKIDISLTSVANGGNDIQSTNIRNKLMNSETFNKVSIKKSKQTDDHISSSIRKNYLQKKYEKAMKKNTNPSVLELEDEPPSLQLPAPSKNSSSKILEFEQEIPSNRGSQQRKYLIKTSNKRVINSGTQYKSLNPTQQRKEISTIKNFRTLRMDQSQKIEKLERMKEKHIEFLSGGRAIRPAFYYRQREHAASMYTEGGDEDFSDLNMGTYKESEEQRKDF